MFICLHIINDFLATTTESRSWNRDCMSGSVWKICQCLPCLSYYSVLPFIKEWEKNRFQFVEIMSMIYYAKRKGRIQNIIWMYNLTRCISKGLYIEKFGKLLTYFIFGSMLSCHYFWSFIYKNKRYY